MLTNTARIEGMTLDQALETIEDLSYRVSYYREKLTDPDLTPQEFGGVYEKLVLRESQIEILCDSFGIMRR